MARRGRSIYVVAAGATLAAVAIGAWVVWPGEDGEDPGGVERSGVGGPSVLDCSARVEGGGPSVVSGPADVVIGPIAFVGLGLARRAPASGFAPAPGGRRIWKAGARVQAGTTVTVSVAAGHEGGLLLDYPQPGRPSRPATSVTFVACPTEEPAFSGSGRVGTSTGFAGGFQVVGRPCPRVEVLAEGRRPVRRALAFGRACAA